MTCMDAAITCRMHQLVKQKLYKFWPILINIYIDIMADNLTT